MSNEVRRYNLMSLPQGPGIEWFDANGINTNTVPIDQVVEVFRDKLRYREFIFEKDGKRIKTIGDRAMMRQVTVELKSDPNNHGLQEDK